DSPVGRSATPRRGRSNPTGVPAISIAAPLRMSNERSTLVSPVVTAYRTWRSALTTPAGRRAPMVAVRVSYISTLRTAVLAVTNHRCAGATVAVGRSPAGCGGVLVAIETAGPPHETRTAQ